MKLIISLKVTALAMICLSASAQQNKIEVISSSPGKTVIRVLVTGFDWKTVETAQGPAKVITLENGIQIAKEGEPDVPMLSVMVPAPDGTELTWQADHISYTDFNNTVVASASGECSNTGKKETDFVPRIAVSMEKPVNFDGENYVALSVYPLQYNAGLKTLRLCNELIITVTGIKETDQPALSVYPNPASGMLNIRYAYETQGNAALAVYNAIGQSVYASSLSSSASAFDISGFPAGVYSVVLGTENGNAVKRVLIQ